MGKLWVTLAAVICWAAVPVQAQALYVAAESNLYTIDPATGNEISSIGPVQIGGTPIILSGLAFSPITGALYGTTASYGNFSYSVVTIDPATGAAALIGADGGLESVVYSISFDSTGVLYGLSAAGPIGTINLTTGTFTTIGALSEGILGGIGFSSVSPYNLFLSEEGSDGPLSIVNKATGAATFIATLNGEPGAYITGMTSNDAGILLASATGEGGGFLLAIDPSDGAVSFINFLPYGAAGISFQPPPAAATSFTLTGPIGGPIGSVSSNFTVIPDTTHTGTITITPSGGGLFTPIVLTFSGSSAAQTFTITPVAVGPVTLTPTNNSALTNPAGLSYATSPAPPTIGTATAGVTSAAIAFTAPLSSGGSPITLYTAACNPGAIGGTRASSPITVSGLTPGTPYTCSVTATNSAGVSAASSVSNTVTPTNSMYTLTGPAGGLVGSTSGTFAVTPNAAFTGTITITRSGGGLSTPIVLTFNGSATAQTFTITPTGVGPVMLTPTNGGSLTNPLALSYATQPSAPAIGSAAPGPDSLSVVFTAPASTGGSGITLYTASCGSATGAASSSPVAVNGLTAGRAYTCTVTATNAFGISAGSSASNQVTVLPPINATPAPSTLVLISIGVMLLWIWRRYRLTGDPSFR